ncbi:MAG TPA: hypothetical protein VNQ90_12675 [Chthoniobacteraceae bacterium]|nr:hypothetical protein [Chthoniobacteraceae bacterium]
MFKTIAIIAAGIVLVGLGACASRTATTQTSTTLPPSSTYAK